jgi:predicted DNA-binding protein (MmcQ/YjbR family)
MEAPEAELRHWIVESYELIRKALPKSVQATLDRTSG